MDQTNVNQSLNIVKKKSYEDFKEWLDNNLKMQKQSAIFYFTYLNYFINNYEYALGYERFFYMEKLFNFALELKLVDFAKNIWRQMSREFGLESKMKRLQAQLLEVENSEDSITMALNIYKTLIKHNQEDKASIKKYLGYLKTQADYESLKRYTDLWNDYLKVYMDDVDAWHELSDMYVFTNNYNKAIYCLEEVILHQPNNFKVYNKIGDILCSMNNNDSAQSAVKYYSQSILIKPSPRAFWGILFALNIIMKVNKELDPKLKNLLKIAKHSLNNYYANSPFKITIEQFYKLE